MQGGTVVWQLPDHTLFLRAEDAEFTTQTGKERLAVHNVTLPPTGMTRVDGLIELYVKDLLIRERHIEEAQRLCRDMQMRYTIRSSLPPQKIHTPKRKPCTSVINPPSPFAHH